MEPRKKPKTQRPESTKKSQNHKKPTQEEQPQVQKQDDTKPRFFFARYCAKSFPKSCVYPPGAQAATRIDQQFRFQELGCVNLMELSYNISG
jgi:hypothetical protein